MVVLESGFALALVAVTIIFGVPPIISLWEKWNNYWMNKNK